ncbi:MAG: Splicing factor [Claussenomyces sp. TS43310]|nr:MAG: Splicing factor [Claussenomyces sp. TS43310]
MDPPHDEPSWLSLIEERIRSLSNDLEQRVGVIELLKEAITEEPASLLIWLAYAEYVTSLYIDSRATDGPWTDEEALLGQELFTKDTVTEIWQEGYQATQHRINDSHLLWNKWVSFELDNNPDVDRIKNLFLARLQIPHAAWDETSQLFSTFLTSHAESEYEQTMISATKIAMGAKSTYAARERYELKILATSEDKDAQQTAMLEYLEWETAQMKKKNGQPQLCYALFERALLAFSTADSIWEDYASTVASAISNETSSSHDPFSAAPSPISILKRATKHCPWSGSLWSRYMLQAEIERLPFSDIQNIKEDATTSSSLDRDGMISVIMVYAAWCGFLRRRVTGHDASAEDVEFADDEIPTVLRTVHDWGERLYGKGDFKGDPKFTLERSLIEYQTQKEAFDEARSMWQKLVGSRGDSYEFWQQYYEWEMAVEHTDHLRPLATAVLQRAIMRPSLDWPEKIIEMFLGHCTMYRDAEGLAKAMDLVHRVSKGVVKRRQREVAEMAAAYSTPLPSETQSAGSAGVEEYTASNKRKRESPLQNGTSKKLKADDGDPSVSQPFKRDRENTSILVTNLPPGVTQTKVRQYFREYGHVNNLFLKTESDGLSATALIEFRSGDDVQSALLRNEKYFGDKQIRVAEAIALTLYVTNYPPTADENYMHKLFKDCGEILDIRWPSLKYNTHRRFCYISFKSPEATAKATSKLNGTMLEGKYKLEVKYSDPGHKKPREGATAEGREIHISGLDREATEDQLRAILSKYGEIESIRILRTMTGKSKGAAFVIFKDADEANSSLELDKTKFLSQILSVELAGGSNYKPKATMNGSSGTGSTINPAVLAKRTITLHNIPDTVNDARIKALAERYGDVVKLVLRPEISGAHIEYSEEASAGKASLGLNGMDFEGRTLKVDEGRVAKDNKTKVDVAPPPAHISQPSVPIRRPGVALGRAKRGRGGLGFIR